MECVDVFVAVVAEKEIVEGMIGFLVLVILSHWWVFDKVWLR